MAQGYNNGNMGQVPYKPVNAEQKNPCNIEAEKSVLAACLLNQEAIEEASMKLEPADFYRPAHQRIFEAMRDMHARTVPVPIDHISLADHLQAEGQLEAVGGKAYLLELSDNTFALANWRSHIEIVKRTAVLRNLVYASAQITALAYDAPDNLTDVIEQAEKLLFNVTEKRVSSTFKSARDLMDETILEIQKLVEQKGHMAGVPSGFADVDDLFHGFRAGELIILAARPGVGKTAFALALAANAAKSGAATAFFSLEMSASQLMQRILASESGVPLSRIRGGFLTDADWSMIIEASSMLSGLDLYIDDSPALSIMELRAKARRELRDKEQGIIIVDYLQLMQPPVARRDGNRAVEVGEISRGLKVLAKEMNMPVIALSQLSRSVEMRGKKRPQLSDLRESGSIEQDADIVMFIDRSMNEIEAEEDGRPELGRAQLIVAKHRNGPTRDIDLAYIAENTKFANYIDASSF